MTKDNSQPVFDIVEAFIQERLADGANPAQLSYTLTAAATQMGLALAPAPAEALALIMKASSDVAMAWISEQQEDDLGHLEFAPAPSTTIH